MLRNLLRVLLPFALPFTFASVASAQNTEEASCSAPTVATAAGEVCGAAVQVSGEDVFAYLGIPYGEDTGGNNRFAPPVPREPWEGVLAATQVGNACPQLPLSIGTSEGGPAAPESEDCLVLNVWAPSEPAELKPVLVFIHGGGFLVGTATDAPAAPDAAWYNIDGRFLAAEQDLVVVSMNYRLGAFGFLGGLPDFDGNYGIQDQQLALEWVQENIAAFGGDPSNVTLMGESAGGTSVAVHAFAAPSSSDLFSRAIIESNPAGFGVYEPLEARGQSEHLLRATGCLINFDRPACLRSKSMEELIEAQRLNVNLLTILDRGIHTLVAWLPVVDGSLLVRQPLIGALDGELGKPLLVGNNTDEAFSFLGQLITDEINPFAGSTAYRLLFGGRVWETIDKDYVKHSDDFADALLDGAGDYVFMCPAQLAALAAPKGYLYRFTHVPQYVGGLTGGETCTDRSCHAVELPYVFGTGRFGGGFTADDRAVSNSMMQLWADFARGAADQGQEFGGWPPAGQGGGPATMLVIDEPLSVSTAAAERCLTWESVYRAEFGD